jgi:HEPN domain-containing protein
MDNLKSQIDFWKKSGERDIYTASSLLQLKRYDACLFFCHLSLEKFLKGLYVKKTKQAAPYIHDLAQLASVIKITLPEGMIKQLRIITTFNISGRYGNIKRDFYKICTRQYANEYFKTTKEIIVWLKKQYRKK